MNDCSLTNLFGPDGKLADGSSGRRGKRLNLWAEVRLCPQSKLPDDRKLAFLQARLREIQAAEAVE